MPVAVNTIYLLAGCTLSAIIGTYAWRNSQTRGNRTFALACFVAIPWMLGEVLLLRGDNYSVQWFGECIIYFGAAFLPVMLYVFVRQFCGREPSDRTIRLLCVVPSISWVVMITNSWHHLFFTEVVLDGPGPIITAYGPVFRLLHTPYSYVILVFSILIVLREFNRASRHYRRQLLMLLVSMSVPITVNVLSVMGVVNKITPYSLPVFFSLFSYAIFRLRFLGSNPIAYETVFQTIRDGVLILDAGDVIHDINPAAARGLGRQASNVIGMHVRAAFAAWPEALELYDRDPQNLGSVEVNLLGKQRFFQIDSAQITGANPNAVEGRIVTIRDITDRHMHQLSLESLAFHDPLTRLANRRKFQEEVERAIIQSDEKNEPFAILYFDLNKFKSVNDTLGHDAGDELLKYVAARVASILRKPDILSRLGGDEFAMLLHNCNEKGVDLVIERMLDNVRRPFQVGEHTLVADLSIGAAYYPKNGAGLTELLRHADAGMYLAKQAARDHFGIIPNEIIDLAGQIAS